MLTGLQLMFMGVAWSNSGLFSTPCFLVSPVGKRGRGAKKKKGRREKGYRKGGKEGRKEEGVKKDRRQDKKEFFNKN